MFLDQETFRTVVTSTPLVSIDLIIRNHDGLILLGQRLNRPAQGSWFVPGGRIYKDESLDAAFERITEAELGRTYARSQARLIDIFDHFYADSVFGGAITDPSTHYVVAGYQLDLEPGTELKLPEEQHGAYKWWRPSDMISTTSVHANTKAYLAGVR